MYGKWVSTAETWWSTGNLSECVYIAGPAVSLTQCVDLTDRRTKMVSPNSGKSSGSTDIGKAGGKGKATGKAGGKGKATGKADKRSEGGDTPGGNPHKETADSKEAKTKKTKAMKGSAKVEGETKVNAKGKAKVAPKKGDKAASKQPAKQLEEAEQSKQRSVHRSIAGGR